MTDTIGTYQSPRLTRHGTVAQLTQGGSTGNQLDADFSDGAFRGDLTFS